MEFVELYGKLIFNQLRNCQTVFQSGFPILHVHQQCMTVPVASHPHQHLAISVF